MDDTTLATTQGKFARVCIELDLKKPLQSRYRTRGREWKLQYEGLQDICFICRKYGHRDRGFPLRAPKKPVQVDQNHGRSEEAGRAQSTGGDFHLLPSRYMDGGLEA